jgi:hypothetical protein
MESVTARSIDARSMELKALAQSTCKTARWGLDAKVEVIADRPMETVSHAPGNITPHW